MALFNSFRSLKNLSLYAVIGLAVVGTADAFSVLIGIGQIVNPEASLDLDEEGLMSIWLMLQGLVYLLKFPTYIFSFVMFLVWIHRAHSNLEPLQARDLQFTPGWAVGWWFIPFANLVKPFQVMREVWSESDPDADPSEGLFLSASLRSAPTYMAVWWGMWILSNIASNITSRVYDPESMANIEIGGVLFVITGVVSVAAAALAIMVVRDITDRQEKRHAELSRRGATNDEPPPPPVFDRDI